MLNLIRNEWLKLWTKKGTWVMVILIAVLMVASAGIGKWMSTMGEQTDWKQTASLELKTIDQELNSGVDSSNLKDQKRILEHRIENNLPPVQPYTAQEYILDVPSMLSIVTLFTVIVGAGMIATEFSTGTIKMLLTRPVKRWKILASKLLTMSLFATVLTAITLGLGIITSYLFFDNTPAYILEATNGEIIEISFWGRVLLLTVLSLVNVLVISVMAFMIGSVFRSSSLAIGISIFLLFMGTNITYLLSMKFEFAKYILFANTDLSQFIGGEPFIEGLTLPFSISVLVIYTVVFLVISFVTFNKRDITA